MDYEANLGPGDTLVLAWASGGPRFEWGTALAALGVPHVLFRDSTDRWYRQGVSGIGDMRAVCDYILARRHGYLNQYPRVVSLGLSSGAYAALLYGQITLEPTDLIIVVSPITGKGEDVKPEFPPHWWPRIEHGPEHPPVPDLRPLFAEGPRPRAVAFVSDGDGTELDRQMAERVGITNVCLLPGYSHSGLARHVRDSGLLRDLIHS